MEIRGPVKLSISVKGVFASGLCVGKVGIEMERIPRLGGLRVRRWRVGEVGYTVFVEGANSLTGRRSLLVVGDMQIKGPGEHEGSSTNPLGRTWAAP
jgi:hypothetical protein